MDNQKRHPSDKAVGCFVHGVAHLIDELGPEAGIVWAANLISHLEGEDHGEDPGEATVVTRVSTHDVERTMADRRAASTTGSVSL